LGPYISTLPLIDRDGKIIDLGCGNGMLIKFIMEFSGHTFIPYGIDIEHKPIKHAKIIHHEYAHNFRAYDINNYDFSEGPFDIIISSPSYAPNMRKYTYTCVENLAEKGRLIYRMHDDVIRKLNLHKLDELEDFEGLNMRISKGDGLVFCIFDR